MNRKILKRKENSPFRDRVSFTVHENLLDMKLSVNSRTDDNRAL